MDRGPTGRRENPRRLVGHLQRSRAERPGRASSTSITRTSSYISRITWKPARWWGRRARSTSPPCRLARPTTGRGPPAIWATSTTANPGKTSQIYSLAAGCFLDPGPFWQNPQPSTRGAVQRPGQRRGSGERTARRASRPGQFLFRDSRTGRTDPALHQTVAADQKSLDLTQAQYDTGVGDQISVVEARTTLQSAQASLTNLGILRAQYEHAIAVLIGKAASGFSIPARPIHRAAPDSHRHAVSSTAAPAGRGRRRTNHGFGQCPTGRGLQRFLPFPDALRERRLRELLVQAPRGLAQPLLVGWSYLLPAHFQRCPQPASISTWRFTTPTSRATGTVLLPSSR